MKTREIKRNEAAAFFNSFSRQHEGWRVTLEVLGSELGDQIEGRELVLEGVTADLAHPDDKIEIMIGARPSSHLTHTITAPTQVSLEQTDDGADAALAIKAADGTTSLLRFCSAMRPELVDAIAI